LLLKIILKETILIIVGAILIGIALIGGNLEWKEIKIPKIHIAARILGFITGLSLIVVTPNIEGLLTTPHGQNSVEETEKTVQAQEQRLAELQRQQDEAALSAKAQQLPELQQEEAETPTQADEKMNVSQDFSLERGVFETQQEYQARINQAVEQRDLRYQTGVAHLKSYKVDSETVIMSIEWQAAWVKPFLGPWRPNKYGTIKLASSEAQALWQAGKEKQLLITLEIVKNRLKVEKVILIDREQTRTVTLSRYVDNGDGTITDNRTDLIWLKNANCFGEKYWKTAMQSAANLAHGYCGLGDGSTPGMWRLPTKEEWEAMVDKRYNGPALSNAEGTAQWKEGDAFLDVKRNYNYNDNYYWSSTSHADNASNACVVYLRDGDMRWAGKTSSHYVWAVRGGH